MKSPDITLCIQAIHFFIAYYMLRTYVFAPALKILNKEEQDDKKLQASIADATSANKEAEQHKQNRWLKMKELLHARVPDRSYKFFSIRLPKMKCSVVHETKTKILAPDRKKLKKVAKDRLSDVSI